MNYFSKIKIGTWIVIVLTIVNLASLGTIIYKTSCERKRDELMENKGPQKPKGGGFHWKQLNLSTNQEKKFREMGKLYFDSVRRIYSLRDTFASKIAKELKKDNPNKSLMYDYSQKMGDNYALCKKLTIDHLLNLKRNCRADQVHKLDSMYHFLLIGFENNRHGRSDRRPNKDSLRKDNKPAAK